MSGTKYIGRDITGCRVLGDDGAGWSRIGRLEASKVTNTFFLSLTNFQHIRVAKYRSFHFIYLQR
jgi:hypothetical protein